MEKNEKRYAKLIRQIRPVLVRRYGEDKTVKSCATWSRSMIVFWRSPLDWWEKESDERQYRYGAAVFRTV